MQELFGDSYKNREWSENFSES